MRGIVRGNLIPALLEASVRHGLRVLILISLLGFGTLYPGIVSRAFGVLGDALKANDLWVRSYAELRQSAGSESLFQQMVRLGLIDVVLRTGEIRIPNCNEVRTRLADPDASLAADTSVLLQTEQTDALRRSCNSEFGRFVRRSIGAWNDGLTVFAVRDNALRDEPCIDQKPEQSARTKAYIPADCHRTRWAIEAQIDREWRAESVRGLQPPSAAAFGFVAAQLLPGFGDWLRIAAPPSAERRRIAATFPPLRGRNRITIDLVGVARSEDVSIENGRLVGFGLLCDVRFSAANCSRDVRERRALAWRLEVERVPDTPLKIMIAAEPLSWRPAKMAELQSTFEEVRKSNPRLDVLVRDRNDEPRWPPDAGAETIHSEGPLALRCIDTEEAVAPCRLTFTVTPTISERKKGTVRILLGDKPLNENTAEGESRPTDLAFDNGLETLVGMGNFDYLALAPQLSRDLREGETRTVNLSLDPRLQAQTLDVLKRAVGDRSDRSFGNIHATLPAQYDRDRRAGIVLIDLAREPGAIRAAASWPTAPKGLNQWDLLALGSWQPTRSPFAPRLWAATDRLSTPGSTFKVVTALALVQAALDGDRAAQDIVKGLNASGLQSILRIDGQSGGYLPEGGTCGAISKSIPNFDDRATCDYVGGCAGGNRLGLRQALQFSINTYFAATATRIDREIADRPNRAASPATPGQRPFYMLEAADRLFPPARFDLAALPSGGSITGARSWAVPFVIESRDPSCNRLHKLALNGIGQAAQASPIAMASALGGIALGNPIRPSLVAGGARRANESILRGWPGPADSNEYYRELLNGLANVVRSGTAASAFRSNEFARIASRVAGKTGTAEPGTKEPNTVWFVGWLSDGPAAQPGSKPELAFACYVTHVGGTGGAVCAPLIARLLAAIATRANPADTR